MSQNLSLEEYLSKLYEGEDLQVLDAAEIHNVIKDNIKKSQVIN